MIFSISQFNSYLRCGESYRRRYLCDEKIPPSISLAMGSSFHEGAKVNHLEKKKTRKNAPLSVVKDAVNDKFKEIEKEGILLSEEDKAEVNLIGNSMKATFGLIDCYYEEFAPLVQPDLVEEQVTVEAPLIFERASAQITGIIDLYTEDRWLSDLKTTSKTSKPAPTAIMQLAIYRELVKAKLGIDIDKASIDQFVMLKKAPKYNNYPIALNRDLISITIARMQYVLNQIQAGNFPPASPDGWQCDKRYCGYFDTCKYVKGLTFYSKGE